MKILTVVFAIGVLVSCGERKVEHKKRTTGYKGEARINPFLAAQRLLEKKGRTVELRSTMGQIDSSVGMLFITPDAINTEGRARFVMDWVLYGGHLVLMLEGGEMRGNDFVIYPTRNYWMMEEDSAGLEYMYSQLSIEVQEKEHELDNKVAKMEMDAWEAMEEKDRVLLGSEKSEIKMDSVNYTLHHWSNKGVEHELYYEGDYGSGGDSAKNHRYLSIGYGEGRVTVLTDARPLRNRYLGEGDHAEFLLALSGQSSGGNIVFTRGKGEGFLEMVWRHFKWAVLGLAAVIVFWLWKNLPRFGPEKDVDAPELREFSQQVRGVGRFLWSNKRDDALLDSLRAVVYRHLGYQGGLESEGMFDRLAAATGIPVEGVIEALSRTKVRDPGAMTRMTKNLQLILNSEGAKLKG